MRRAAGSRDYPRSSERRHFRGDNARKSVEYLEGRGVEYLFDSLVRRNPTTARAMIELVQTWVGFGPWIAFKVADMLERLELRRVIFCGVEALMFDSPRKGAELYCDYMGLETDNPCQMALDSLRSKLPLFAPPRHERLVNSQEIETVLCKWKSHCGGHYQVGDDIQHLKKALDKFDDPLSVKLSNIGEKLWPTVE